MDAETLVVRWCYAIADVKLGQLLIQSAMEVILSKEARTTMSKLRPGEGNKTAVLGRSKGRSEVPSLNF